MDAHYMQGCRLTNFHRLLWHNRKEIDWKHQKGRIAWVWFNDVVLALPGLVERAMYHRRIQNTVVEQPPVFILGHWRSGTTYLFNLLSCDENTAYMNSMETFMFDHFLTLHKFLVPFFNRELDGTRPGDSMDFNLDSPQEECYTMANILEQTYTHLITFPQAAQKYIALSFEAGMTQRQRVKWCKTHEYVLKKMTYAKGGKRMLFKSPDNTTKAAMLHKLYPQAKFIHIYRDPYRVVSSTVKTLLEGMPQMTFEKMLTREEIEEQTVEICAMLYRQYLKDLPTIPPEQILEINYDDLVAAPMETLERIYTALNLPGFARAREGMQAHVDSQKHYRTNQFHPAPSLVRQINEKLGFFFEHYHLPMRELEET